MKDPEDNNNHLMVLWDNLPIIAGWLALGASIVAIASCTARVNVADRQFAPAPACECAARDQTDQSDQSDLTNQ